VGGAGVTNGALSSKTWWELSRETAAFRKNLNRFNLEAPNVIYKEIQEEVKRAIQERKSMLEEHMEHLRDSNYSNLLDFKIGTAHLLSPHEVEIVNGVQKEVVFAQHIILATGSRPRYLAELPIDEKIVMTSEGIENMEDFPDSMVIVGAGVIGCEYATIFSGFGKTKVHLIDKGDRILPFEDEDVVKIIERNMENSGVLIHRNSKLMRMEIKNNRVEYELEYNDGGKEIFNVEKALVSVGRIPNLEELWDDKVGIGITKRGIEDASGRRDCVHMRLTTPEAFIRFVGNGLHPTDYTRIDSWIQRIKSWKQQGIRTVYFFMHQHEELHSPELCKYVIQQLNKHCGTSIPEPAFVETEQP